MNHPYASYIESKATEYYERQAHEPQCKTLQPYDYSGQTDSTGFVYDCYIPQHCDCWLTYSFKDLNLARKFLALQNLSHRFGLHSASCARYKRTSIMYRNKPEVMTGWCNCWLSVPIRHDPENSCPVCSKPLLFAPRAPEHTPKKACVDPRCVNAHGIIHEAPFDKWDKIAVEYNETPKEKENTMPNPKILSDLTRAKNYASAFSAAQHEVNDFLEPFVRQYVELRRELSPNFTDLRDSDADRFVEIDGENFWMTGDESYLYGETYTPMVSLPFAFVADPEKFAADARKAEEERKRQANAKKKADAQEKVDKLKAQLAKAEEALAKASQNNDPISTIATRNQAQKLRDDLAQSATPEQG